MLLGIVFFFILLSVLVLVHELGHFVAARRLGVSVDEFGMGYPPRLLKLWQEEGWIVINGVEMYVGRRVDMPFELYPGVKVAYASEDMPGGGIALTKIQVARPERAQKEQADAGELLPPPGMEWGTVESLRRGTEYTLNAIPFGGFVRLVGEDDPRIPGSFSLKSKRVRFTVLVAGATMNLLLAVVLFTLTFMSGVPEPVIETVINSVLPGSPADVAGVQVGDVVLKADDVRIDSAAHLVDYTVGKKGEEVTLTLLREGEELQIGLVPRVNPPPGEGAMGIGISSNVVETKIVYYKPVDALLNGVQYTVYMVGLTFYIPIAILKDVIPAEAARPVGPVGIYQISKSAVDASVQMGWWFPVLNMAAFLSTALAVANLLPIPGLDGGRILFVLIEAVRRKRIPPDKEGAIHMVGMAVLVFLMLVVSYFDVVRPVTIPDWSNPFQ